MAEIIDAIKAGDEGRVRELLAQDQLHARARDENGVTAVLVAQYHGRRDLVEDLAAAAEPDLDIFEAAALGRTARLGELLQDDPDLVNAWSPDGFSPLQLASFFGHPDAAALLLDGGAETDAVAKNPMRVTALHSACAAGDARIARLLLDNGADPNARQEGGFTPIQAAAQNGDEELAQLLLDRGADPGAATDAGKTAADFASESGHEELAARLRA
jgi:ankyrin repeat protein